MKLVMQSEIAQLTQHSLLAGSLVLLSTTPLHAQEFPKFDSPIPSGENASSRMASTLTNISVATQPAASLDRNTPRTLQEAGLDTSPVVPVDTSEPFIPATSVSQAPSTTEAASYQPISPQIGGSFTSGPGTGYDSSYFGLEGFVPLAQTPGKSLGYLQGRFILDTADGNPGGNLILGYRTFNPKTRSILGGYLGFDIRDTGRATFTQLGLGLEAVLPSVEFRVNGYLPLGSRRREVDSQNFSTSSSNTSTSVSSGSGTTTPTLRFQGNNLLFDLPAASTLTSTTRTQTTRFTRSLDQVSLAGFDAEAGVKVAQLGPTSDLRSYLGMYYYTGEGVSSFVGVRGRLALRLNDAITAGLSVQGDREFGTTVVGTINFRFAGGRRNPAAGEQATAWARMGEGVNRSQTVAVTQRTRTSSTTTETVQSSTQTVGSGTGGTVIATNPATNQPWVFQHVVLGGAAGTGTFESPFSTVANALTAVPTNGNGVVYVQAGTNPGIPAFTIPQNVQVLSTGVLQTLATVQQGTVNLPLSAAGGTLPTVTGTVTMGNNSTLAGFNVTPPVSNVGILANGVQNVTVRQNRVSVSGGGVISGIELRNVTGTATVMDNTINTSGGVSGFGIWVLLLSSSLTNATLSNNTITTTDLNALGIVVVTNGGSITNATLSGNTITTSGSSADGIQVGVFSSFSALTLTNNTILQAGANSVQIQNFGVQPLCVEMTGNRSQNPNFAGGGGFDFNLVSNAQPFRVVNLPTVSANNFSGTFRYDGAGAPAAPFANVTTCP